MCLIDFPLQCNELVARMLILGDREHEGRKEEVEAYNELNEVKAKLKSSLEENGKLKEKVAPLEQEVAKARAIEDSTLRRANELEWVVADFENSKIVIRADAMDVFRTNEEYTVELKSKAASKI